MFHVTYLLLKTGQNSNIDIACCGRTGKVYGYYKYEHPLRAHVFRISQEKWEGGAGEDITKKMRQLAPPLVMAIVEPDESVKGMAEELDRLNLHLAKCAQPDEAQFMQQCLHKLLSLPGAPSTEELAAMISADEEAEKKQAEEASKAATQEADAFEELAEIPATTRPHSNQPLSEDPLRAAFESMNHRELRKMCQDAKAAGHKVPLSNPKREEMIEALYLIQKPETAAAA